MTNKTTATVQAILRRSAPLWMLSAVAAEAQVSPSPEESAPAPQEIVVTAQRRTQSVQDVPYNISAVGQGAIQEAGATSINDLTRLVPGLTTVDEGAGARGQTNNLTLRGLRTNSPGGGQATTETPGQTVNSVSTYWGETPIFFPMPLYDIDHVEVLRGPQGTLYGSGAEAGTIRFIPVRPQFDRVSGEAQVEGSAIEKASQFNNWNREARAILNVPLSDTLAVRMVAGVEHDGGFITNNNLVVREGNGQFAVPIPSIPGDLTSGPVIGPSRSNTNTASQWFARAALRWAPNDKIDIQAEYLHQYIYAANTQYSSPGYAGGRLDLTAPNAAAPPGADNPAQWPNAAFNMNPGDRYTSAAFIESPYKDNTNLFDLVATADVGFATVTSATSYYSDNSVGVSDWTGLIDNPATVNYNLFFPYNGYPRIVTPAYVPAENRAFVQELRLVSKAGSFFDYVVGGYYNRQPAKAGWLQLMPGIAAYNAAIGMPNPSADGDIIWDYNRNTLFQDRALFGELTAHLTSAWQITGGVRYFSQSFKTDTLSRLPFCGAVCASDQEDPQGVTSTHGTQSIHRHVWKWNTSYDLNRDTKVYLTYSEGFRRGGANAVPIAGTYASLPAYLTFEPDLAKNYELGIKGALFDRALSYTVDVYRVNLNNFQFDGVNLSGLPLTYNGSTARSQGAEVDLQAQLGRRTRVSLGYAYTDATVQKTFQLNDYPSYATIPSLGGDGQTAPLFGGPIAAGTRLPGVPKSSFTASVEHTVPVPVLGNSSLTLHADGAYRTAESANIVPTSVYNWEIPSSFVGNARATLDTGGSFAYSVFVENFTDAIGYSGGTNVQAYPYYGRFRFVTRPRTWGASVTFKF
ncbi:MAG: TonB-dependent receptor [Proteobacteria bacterium]|nr:TonB-dependent receptor [Pseudomonadota bacterium]